MAQDEFEIVLNEYAAAVVERAKSNLRIKRKVRGKTVNRVASGNLLRSLTYKARVRYNKPTIDFTVDNDATGQYADVIEFGRRPGARAPKAIYIEGWIREKIKIGGFKLRNRQGQFVKTTESRIKSAAYAIAQSIGKNGIEGIKYYTEAIEDTWPEYADRLIEGYVKGVENRLLLNKR